MKELVIKKDGTEIILIDEEGVINTINDNLADYIPKSDINGLIKNDGTVDTNTYLTTHQDISGKENTSNKVTSWGDTLSDTKYPSEKLVKETIDNLPSSSSSADVTVVESQSEIDGDGIYLH